MEPEQIKHDEPQPESNDTPGPEPVKPAKNPKRVAAGKKLVELNKKAKEKMLEDIAEAKANANEANTTLKNYLDKLNSKPVEIAVDAQGRGMGLASYQTPIIISGALLIAALYIWSSKQRSAVEGHIPAQPVPSVPAQPRPQTPAPANDDIYAI